MVLNVEHISGVAWIEVCKRVDGAVIFLDDTSAECLHWHGGHNRLKKAGAISVKKFSSFAGGNEDDKKAVFLVANPLIGSYRLILRDIIANSIFEHCVLITTCSPAVLNFSSTSIPSESSNDFTALHKLESDILLWMRNTEYTVEVFHSYTFGFIPLNDYFFIAPAFHELFPCFEEDLDTRMMQNTKLVDWNIESLPLDLQISVIYFVTSLNSLLSQLNVCEDIYSLGPFSNLISSVLQKNSSSHLRSKTASSMSILLIDRTLDVCTPVSFTTECLMDLMKSVLPTFPGHTIDVAINMDNLFVSPSMKPLYNHSLPPGCLHDPKVPMFDWLFHRPAAEILRGVSKEICAVLKEKEQVFSPKDIENLLKNNFTRSIEFMKENSGILQFSLGMCEALKSSSLEILKLIRSFQMLLCQALASENKTDDALNLIVDLIRNRKSKGFELEHILFILVFFYSFTGEKYEVHPGKENLLKDALKKAISEDKHEYCDKAALKFNPELNTDELCVVIFKKLKSLKTCRNYLFKYRDVTSYQDSMMPLEYQSVLTQLLKDILDPMKVGIPDLRHKPNLSLKENFTSRFSMLLGSSRTHITDNDSLLIFFIGGITAQEVSTIKRFFKHFQKPVLIGSTSLLSPSDLMKKLFL